MKQPTLTLLASLFYFTTSFAVWVLLGALGPYIKKDFGLSSGEIGLLVAIPLLGGSLVRIPMGIWVDRIGAKKVGIWSQILVLAAVAGTWLLASEFSQLLALGLFLGIAGGSFAVAIPLASRWYPCERQGIILGIVGIGNSGTVLAHLFAPRLAESLGWRTVFGWALLPLALILFIFILCAKEKGNDGSAGKKEETLLFSEDLFSLSFFYALVFGGFVGLASFLGIFFHEQYGLEKVTAGSVAAVGLLAGSFARPFGGYLADRFGGIEVLGNLFGLAGGLLLALATFPPLGAEIFLVILSTACLGLGSGAVFQVVPQRFPEQMGVATGIVGAAGGLGGFFLPLLLGSFKDLAGTYAIGFGIFSILNLAAWFLLKKEFVLRTAEEVTKE